MIKIINTYYQSQPDTEFFTSEKQTILKIPIKRVSIQRISDIKNKTGITTALSERLYTHIRREYQVSPGDFEFLFVHDLPVSVVGVNMSKTGNYTV
jgi:hypothetical protein